MRELEARLTSKGRVTIPIKIRHRLGLEAGDTIQFEVAGDAVRIKTVKSTLLKGFGAVRPRKKPEDWNRVREDFEEGIAEEADPKDK